MIFFISKVADSIGEGEWTLIQLWIYGLEPNEGCNWSHDLLAGRSKVASARHATYSHVSLLEPPRTFARIRLVVFPNFE